MSKEKVLFIAREDMTSVFESSSIPDLPEMAYQYFMHYDNEILYLLDDGKLSGVLSIGDLERFFNRRGTGLKINKDPILIRSIDPDLAAVFFERSLTINEIPVVTEQDGFLGVIRKEKTQNIREHQRRSLRSARTGEFFWRRGEVARFIKETSASVFLYTYSGQKVMDEADEEDKQKIRSHILKMNKNTWEALSQQEWEAFLGGEADILKKERRSCKPVFMNGKAKFPDMEGTYYTIRNGHRFTPGGSEDADRRIFMFGPCIAFGAYCKDGQTIEAYLQSLLRTNGYSDWNVFNRGLFSGEFCYDQMFMEELSKDDIVIIIGTGSWIPETVEREDIFRGDLTEAFMKIPHLADHVLDNISHCDHVVNQKLAEQIYMDICATGLLAAPKKTGRPKKIQDHYINWSIREYFMDYFQQYRLDKGPDDAKIGAIVMNCDPFTKGHRHLIERALEVADTLYIFVVEEDKSYFKFEDRFEMVRQGVADLSSVRVVPSGRYIISQETFAQYFEKERVQTVDSMDYDIYIFGEVVAPYLGIRYRFVGEEPFDKVTRAYNETMKRILPGADIEVIEFPRALSDDDNVISATMVRKAMQDDDTGTIERLCPESTVRYLRAWSAQKRD